MSFPASTWWRHAVVYQIYPRSFADANADGIGDLRGIVGHVDHLRGLSVDAVWLSPFYPSALADGGYDVDDYRAVAPELGTLDDFDTLVATLHEADIRLIVDIVPNHTSNRHAWFREAVAAGPGSDARGRYVIRRGSGPMVSCGPPTGAPTSEVQHGRRSGMGLVPPPVRARAAGPELGP